MDPFAPQDLSIETDMLPKDHPALKGDSPALAASGTILTSPSHATFKTPLDQSYIWTLICQHADLPTCKQIRLVNRAASKPAAQRLFQEVYIMALSDCFEKLSCIASDAIISKYVKKIVYVSDILNPDYCNLSKWKQDAWHDSNYAFSNEDMAKYVRFRGMFLEQRALLNGNFDTISLRTSLPLLENLGSIDIISLGNLLQRFVNLQVPLASRLLRETLIDPMKSLMHFTVSPENARPLEAYIQACSSKFTGVRNLTVDHCPWGFWQVSPITQQPATFPRIRSLLGNAFLNLSSLTMTSFMGSMKVAEQGQLPIEELVAFLKATPNLQHLSLKCQPLNEYYSNWSEAEDTELTGLFEELTWMKLKSLTLSRCFSERDAFVQFMERHKVTLSNLHLDQFTLTEKPVAPLSIVGASLSGVGCWTKYFTQPASPEASWELAIQYLARFLKLENADLHNVDDKYLTRVSGGSIKASTRFISGEVEANRWRFCQQLTRYLLLRGEGVHFPVYGCRQVAGCGCTICQ
ncbi:hypothetical protein BDZ45DRAFT_687909 [Acephala macrosclerotiorum]|nr:hypothetical protein BDZ45DRAFT_687909 [Acephala macrosclerotiorum]